MKKIDVKKSIRKLALKNGISIEEIYKEIDNIIEIGLSNPDPAIQKYWSRIPYKGLKPTPEELIIYLAKQIKK